MYIYLRKFEQYLLLSFRGLQVTEADETTSYLVSMPTKFRKNVWIKRGDYCIVEPIQEGDKVKAEIVRILYKDQIRFIKSENSWPFKDPEDKKSQIDLPPSDSESDTEFSNPNRNVVADEASEDSSDEQSD